jgi:adenosylhomocysteine nucleosidase
VGTRQNDAATGSTGPFAPSAVVIAAMGEEAAAFAAFATDPPAEPFGGAPRFVVVNGAPVALMRSGIGFTNATIAAARSFHLFGSAVPMISIGSAGGLATDVELGDVVVGRQYVNLNADATVFGYRLGQVPGMPERYAADTHLVDHALDAVVPFRVRSHVIGSSEVFVADQRARALRETFPDVGAVDMESAAIAQFAHVHDVPFVSVRGISDLCAPTGEQFRTHLDDASERAARVAVDLVTAWHGALASPAS